MYSSFLSVGSAAWLQEQRAIPKRAPRSRFFQWFLPLKMPPVPPFRPAGDWSIVPWLDEDTMVRFDFDPNYYSEVSISPDGKCLAANLNAQLAWDHAMVANLQTGDVTLLPFPGSPETRTLMISWDPINPAYMYILYEDLGIGMVYYVKYDGTSITQITEKKDNIVTARVTPDGQWLLLSYDGKPPVSSPQSIEGKCFRSIKNKQNVVPVDFADKFYYMSPNMKYVSNSYQIFERSTQRVAEFLLQKQIAIDAPDAKIFNNVISKYCWLPDSTGMLVPVGIQDNQYKLTRSELWSITVDGQALRLSRNCEIIAGSINGKHWLFRQAGKYYLVSVPD